MTDLETLLRAVSDLRAEIRADMQTLRQEMSGVAGRMVERGEHAAQLAALEQRITVLETYRDSRRTGLVYPLVVGILLVAVGALGTLIVAKGGA